MTKVPGEEQRRDAIQGVARLPHEELAELVLAFAEGQTVRDLRRTKARFLKRIEEEIKKAKAEATTLRENIEREEAWIDGYKAAVDAMQQNTGEEAPKPDADSTSPTDDAGGPSR